jgi:hypothetical protein
LPAFSGIKTEFQSNSPTCDFRETEGLTFELGEFVAIDLVVTVVVAMLRPLKRRWVNEEWEKGMWKVVNTSSFERVTIAHLHSLLAVHLKSAHTAGSVALVC